MFPGPQDLLLQTAIEDEALLDGPMGLGGRVPRPPNGGRPSHLQRGFSQGSRAGTGLADARKSSAEGAPRITSPCYPSLHNFLAENTAGPASAEHYFSFQQQKRMEWRRAIQEQIERNARLTRLAEMKRLEAVYEEMRRRQEERTERRQRLQAAMEKLQQRQGRQRERDPKSAVPELPCLALIAKEQGFICDSRLNSKLLSPSSPSPRHLRITPRRELLERLSATPPAFRPPTGGTPGSAFRSVNRQLSLPGSEKKPLRNRTAAGSPQQASVLNAAADEDD